MTQLSFRSYREGDEHAICELFELVYARELPMDVWRWRFEKSPAGKGVIELAWDGDVLAGHYAVTPVWLSHEGERVRSGLSGTTMTHPKYRGLGLFQTLAERTYARMRDEGFACVWGFPNSNSHRGFVERLGWQDIERVPFVSLEVGTVKAPPPARSAALMSAAHDDLDVVCASMRALARWLVFRDPEYLAWRFLQHPDSPYEARVMSQDGVALGYSMTKVYRDRRQVVDLGFMDESVVADLVAGEIQAARESGSRYVDLWMPVGVAAHRALERVGFHPSGPVTYFGVAPFPDCTTDIADATAWYYAMADSDVF